MAPKFGLSPGLESRFARGPLELKNSGLGYYRIGPATGCPSATAEQEEVYVVISGSARMKVGDDLVELDQWDALRVPGHEWRAFEEVLKVRNCWPSAHRTPTTKTPRCNPAGGRTEPRRPRRQRPKRRWRSRPRPPAPSAPMVPPLRIPPTLPLPARSRRCASASATRSLSFGRAGSSATSSSCAGRSGAISWW